MGDAREVRQKADEGVEQTHARLPGMRAGTSGRGERKTIAEQRVFRNTKPRMKNERLGVFEFRHAVAAAHTMH